MGCRPGNVGVLLSSSSPLNITPPNLNQKPGQNEYLPLPIGKILTSLQGICCCSVHLQFSILIPCFLSRLHFMILLPPPLPHSLSPWHLGTSQAVERWGEPWRLGRLWVEVLQSSSASFPDLPQPPPSGLPGPMLPSKAFYALSYPSFTQPQRCPPSVSCSTSKNSPAVCPQSLAPHMHSAPLVFRVTTPCLGNYAAGDKRQLAASIISIIDHWNCPLILNSGIHSVFTCPVNQSYFFSECMYCVTVICIFILLFYKQTFGFLTFFAKSMNF